ncbi:MAG: dephospho-CoA kinase [Peptococcales bacterium]
MLIVGLTGGIASGKSTISDYLKEMGAVIIDADLLARQVVEPGEKAWWKIKEYFGNQVINADDSLNRKKLAEIVFADLEKRNVLNEIIHPEVIAKTKEMINNYKKEGQAPLVVVDAPLLIEAGMENIVDEIWVIAVEEQVQLARVMRRDQVTREKALQRLKAQMPTAEKLKYAHRVIDNNHGLEHTLKQVKEIWQKVVSEQ